MLACELRWLVLQILGPSHGLILSKEMPQALASLARVLYWLPRIATGPGWYNCHIELCHNAMHRTLVWPFDIPANCRHFPGIGFPGRSAKYLARQITRDGCGAVVNRPTRVQHRYRLRHRYVSVSDDVVGSFWLLIVETRSRDFVANVVMCSTQCDGCGSDFSHCLRPCQTIWIVLVEYRSWAAIWPRNLAVPPLWSAEQGECGRHGSVTDEAPSAPPGTTRPHWMSGIPD